MVCVRRGLLSLPLPPLRPRHLILLLQQQRHPESPNSP
jgi:hypothetical protein